MRSPGGSRDSPGFDILRSANRRSERAGRRMLGADEMQEANSMAEMVIRRHHRSQNRWMPRRALITRARVKRLAAWVRAFLPGYVLGFSDVLGMPSAMALAYGCALSALGQELRPVMLGGAAAVLVRALSGMQPCWELLLSLGVLLIWPRLLLNRGNAAVMAITGLLLLPTVFAGAAAPTAAVLLQHWGSVVLAVLSAPVMARALSVLREDRPAPSMEARVSVGYLAAMLLGGAVRMQLLGVNLGVMGASCVVMALAMQAGAGAGCAAGMIAGLMMALQGFPLFMSIALAAGGFLAGMATPLGRRWHCAGFAIGAWLPMLLGRCNAIGMGGGVLAGALVMLLLPRKPGEDVQRLIRRFLPTDAAPGDAYAASALRTWEQTIAAMADALPSPAEEDEPRDAAWWECRLCQGCPDRESCGCMTTPLCAEKAEAVWACRDAADEVWQGALEHLRGMGCKRLYFLLDSMNALRQEAALHQRVIRQALAQRDMLVTHLTALSGAARRFALSSGGESWWEHRAARRIRQHLSEEAIPATLSFVRRVQGHVHAGFELHHLAGARQLARELCALASAWVEAPLQLESLQDDRVLLTECPLFLPDVGMAAEPVDDEAVCGDTVWSGRLNDGQYMLLLSDGMGHGRNAARISGKTAELIRLCLQAGYSSRQALMAVNGMLLMGGSGERFATADLVLVDAWTGHGTLYKLGTPCSWLYRQGEMHRLPGDALPLGIIEGADCRVYPIDLGPEDALVLLSDGVEDAFAAADALQRALASALQEPTTQEAADALLLSALSAGGGQRSDDQSVIVLRMKKNGKEQN